MNKRFVLLSSIFSLIVGLSGCLLASCAYSQDANADVTWHRFRGRNGAGVFPIARNQQPQFETEPSWEVKLAGVGNGSPVIFHDRIYIQSADLNSGAQFVQCFDAASGDLLWQREFAGVPHPTHAWGSLASSTPTVDADRVYVAWGSPLQTALVALSHQGDLVWQIELGPNRFEHGFGSSPTLIDGKLIFFHSQDAATDASAEPKHSRMFAFDPATGKPLWETPMPKDTRVCYGVPVEVKMQNNKVGILAADTGHGIFCLDSETGKLLWETPVVRQRAVAGVMLVGDLALASSGSGGGGNQLAAIRVSDQTEVYRISRNANYVPMPVVIGRYLFVPNDKGILSCCHLETGETLQQRRINEGRFNISASLVAIGNSVIAISDEGLVRVIRGDEEMLDQQQWSLGEGTRATPAIQPNLLVCRTDSKLLAFKFQLQTPSE